MTRNNRWEFGASALVAAFGLIVIGGDALGQLSGVQIIALARGSNSDKDVLLHVKGPSDVLQTELVFQSGGQTGWHTHPGPGNEFDHAPMPPPAYRL